MSQDYRELLAGDLLSDSRGYLNDTADALRSGFAGASAPSSPVAYQVWIDTTTGYIKRRNAANDAWIVVGVLGSAYGGALPLSGGTMSGALNMGGQIISNVGQGTGTAAARVQELDLKAPLAAPTLTGDATVNQDPAGSNSIIRRSWAEGRYLKLSGGTMTGALVLAGDAAADLQAVTRQQLRGCVNFNTTTGHRHDGSDARKARGADLDSGAASSGQILVANGSSGVAWKAAFKAIAHGRVASNGAVSYAGSGNWTPSRQSAGYYTLTISGGVFSVTPTVIVSLNGYVTFIRQVQITLTSATSIGITIFYFPTSIDSPTAQDNAFSFIALE